MTEARSRLRRNVDRFARDYHEASQEDDTGITYDSDEELDLEEFVQRNHQQNEETEAARVGEKLTEEERRKKAIARKAQRKVAEEGYFNNVVKPDLLYTVQSLGYNELSKHKPTDDDNQPSVVASSIFDAQTCYESLRKLQHYLMEDKSTNRKVWRQLASWKIVEHELLTILMLLRNTESFNDYALELTDLLVAMTTLPLLPGEEKENKDPTDDDQDDIEGLGTREERQRAKLLNFQYSVQLPILQHMKKAFLNKAVMASLIETVMSGFVKAVEREDEEITYKPEMVRNLEDYTISVMTLLVNLLKISDAKTNTATSSDMESNMQELFVKILKESHALELIIVIIQYLIEQRNSSSNTIFAKAKLLKWYLLAMELIALLLRNEIPSDLFSATTTPKVVYTSTSGRRPLSPVNAEKEKRQIVVNTSSDYSKKLLREAITQEYRENARQKVTTPIRHSRFGGSYVRSNDVGNPNQQRKTMTVATSQVVGGKVKLPTDAKKRARKGVESDQENKTDDEEDDEEKQKKKLALAQPSQFVFHNIGLAREKSLPQVKQAFSRAKMPVEDEFRRKPSTIETKKIVKAFATELLKTCFNEFIKNIWEALCAQNDSTHFRNIHGFKLQDESNFLLLIKFGLEFNRCLHDQNERIRRHQQTRGQDENIENVHDSATRFEISLISQILQPEILDYVLNELIVRYPLKKQWVNLAHVVAFLKELMITLDLMVRSEQDSLTLISSRVLHRILYDHRHCDSLVRLVRAYRPQLNSRLYLADLVELIDVFVRIVQESAALEMFYTKKRQTTRKKKKEEEDDEDMDLDELARRAIMKDAEGDKRFDVEQFKRKFANSFVIKQYCFLLRFYTSNTSKTNKQVLSLLKMVADDCSAEPLLYQLSLFKTINDILSDPVLSLSDDTNLELVQFCRRLVRNFIDACNNDHKFLPAEFIFLKSGAYMEVYGSEEARLADVEGEDEYVPRSTRKRRRSSRKNTEEKDEEPSEYSQEESQTLTEEGEEEYLFAETQEEEHEAEKATPVRSRKKRRRKQ